MPEAIRSRPIADPNETEGAMAPVTGILSTPKTSVRTVGVAARGTGVGVGGVGVGVGDTGDGLGDALGDGLGDGDGPGDRVGDGEGLGMGVSVGVGLGVAIGEGTAIAVGDETGVALAAILPKPRSGNIRSKTWPHVTTTRAATSTTSRVRTCDFFIRNLLWNRPLVRPVAVLAPWRLSDHSTAPSPLAPGSYWP